MTMERQKEALVFGASGGIGTAVASILSGDNFRVTEASRAECELSDSNSIRRYLDDYPDVPQSVIFAAGVNVPQELSNDDLQNFRITMEINAQAALQIYSHFAPKQAEYGGGSNVVISSLYSQLSRRGRSAYSASKSALEALVRSFALEFASGGVRFNSIQPGFIDTSLTRQNNSAEKIDALKKDIPIGRLGGAEEVASAVRYFVSHESSYVTGASLKIDGGYSLE